MTENTPILQVNNLSRFVFHNGTSRAIIDNFSFAFEARRIYTVLGPSGAGKSSLLRLLNRLDESSEGTILFHGKNTSGLSPCELRCRVGFLFQIPYLFDGTVLDNIRYANPHLTDHDITAVTQQTRIKTEMLDTPSDNLSVGEKQRVALARLLATNPEIALLDEPTSSLDPSNTEAIEHLIKRIVDDSGLTVIMVTHNPEQALRMGGIALLMANGKLIESGSYEQVVNHPQTELGRRYRDRELT